MKYGYQQILAFLSSFDSKDVEKAYEVWREGMEEDFRRNGWYPVDKKPEGKEYFEINGRYWVQDRKKHLEQVRKEFEKKNIKIGTIKKPVRLNYDPVKTDLKCPICGEGLYRQPICPSCVDGRKGYRVRLICGNNTDHVFLV